MKNNTSTISCQTTQEKTTVIKNIVLEGVTTLKADKVTSIFEVKRELNFRNKPCNIIAKKQLSETCKHMSFNLVEVTVEELSVYRKSSIPSFVLKVDGKYYYTKIPNNISFVGSTIMGAHQCAVAKAECARLSAASDANGGCAKVRENSTGIEKYEWITSGYETFNTHHDSFVVTNCLHYKPCPPREPKSSKEVNDLKLGLAQYVWPEVRNLSQVRERKQANRDRNYY